LLNFGPSLRLDLTEAATDIVVAYVASNSLRPAALISLIESVHVALAKIATGDLAELPSPAPVLSAREASRSLTPDYIVCLEDGKKFKFLTSHLVKLGMTPSQYRAKWNLPTDFPMTAPNYSAHRSALAKEFGLGQSKGRRASPNARV
jgi:predicted transcriptional regulator